MPSGLFFLNSLNRSISSTRGVWFLFIIKMFYRNSCMQTVWTFCGIWSGLHFLTMSLLRMLGIKGLTLKVPRKPASENVVCLYRLLNILANFSNLFFAYQQTVWTLIRLLPKEQSDLGPHCLQKWLLKLQADDKADDNCCDWQFKG